MRIATAITVITVAVVVGSGSYVDDVPWHE